MGWEELSDLMRELDDLIQDVNGTGFINLERKRELENLISPEMNGALPVYTPA